MQADSEPVQRPVQRRESPWWTYCKSVLYLLPPLIVFGVAAIFVLPKIKQMCADTGYDARTLFGPLDFVADQGWWIGAALLLSFCAAELALPNWAKYRRAVLGCLVYLLNSAVLVSLIAALIVSAIVGPAMARLH